MSSAEKNPRPASKGEEHRQHRRYRIAVPVEIRFAENPVSVQTSSRNLSAKGVYFTLDPEVRLDSELDFYMTLPPQMCQGRSIRVHCRGRVVRRESLSGESRLGVAAAIDEYEFLPAD